MMEIEKCFGVNLKRLRKAKKLTQEQLAEKLDIARNTLSKLETGRAFVSADMLARICATLEIKAAELFFSHEYRTESSIYYKRLLDNLKSDKIKRNPRCIKLLYEISNEFLNFK